MPNLKNSALFLLLLSVSVDMSARTKKVNHLEIAQEMINQAYKMGYVDAAPIEMNKIEQKMKDARRAKEKRNKKQVIILTEQIKVDLKIVKKRYEVNKQHQQLTEIQNKNMESQKILDELKRQL